VLERKHVEVFGQRGKRKRGREEEKKRMSHVAGRREKGSDRSRAQKCGRGIGGGRGGGDGGTRDMPGGSRD